MDSKKMNLAVGSLVLLGFLFLLLGAIFHITGYNILETFIDTVFGFFLASITCFLVAIVIEVFGENETK